VSELNSEIQKYLAQIEQLQIALKNEQEDKANQISRANQEQ
jgi:hypothetical protein